MADIKLNDDQIQLLKLFDDDLDVSLYNGLRDESASAIYPPVPGIPGYGELVSASRQAIRETFRLMFGTYIHTNGILDTLVDMSGSPGDCEINSKKGRFALDPGYSKIDVANNQVMVSSVVTIVPEDDQSPMANGYWYVQVANGGFTFSYDGAGYTGVHRFVVH